MSFPRYPAYKDSGVEWLGEVPANWRCLKLGYLCAHRPCYGVLVPDFDPDGVPMLRITDMEQGTVDRAALTTISHRLSEEYSRTIVATGDVALSVVGSIGKIALIDENLAGVNLSRAVARVRLGSEMEAAFLRYFVQSLPFQRYVDLVCVGTAQRVLNMDDLVALTAVAPTVGEQRAITAFLDRETAKIDALVAEQRRLMDLLREKRHAVISHAVTKGLNPDAPIKESGVEWLGEVPAHWEIRPLHSLARNEPDAFSDGDWIEAPYITEEGVRLLQTGNVGVGYFKEQGYRYVSERTFLELRCTEVAAGDVLICRLAEPVGRACKAPDLGVRMITSVDVCILKPDATVIVDYVVHLLSSASYLGFMEGQCRGGTRDRVSRSFLGAVRVCLPPLEEQDQIARTLNSAISGLDSLLQEQQRAIELLTERRAALVTAAVTGQIDTRGMVEAAA